MLQEWRTAALERFQILVLSVCHPLVPTAIDDPHPLKRERTHRCIMPFANRGRLAVGSSLSWYLPATLVARHARAIETSGLRPHVRWRAGATVIA